MKLNIFVSLLLAALVSAPNWAKSVSVDNDQNDTLHTLPGFFRFSFDNNIQMPNQIPSMGLLGIDYMADVTPSIYAGFGGYGSVTGTQGGLFVLGIDGGLHREIIPKWWGDVGIFVGGGGGKDSFTGGGLMVRPHAGVAYSFPWARLGVYYSYITFPSGEIHSQQVGFNLDLPMDFSYLTPHDSLIGSSLFDLEKIHVPDGKFIGFQHNDLSVLAQAYKQHSGTKNSNGYVQDETMGLVGAELDHYFTDHIFWWLKMSGAFRGSTNGYMDVLGGLGYHLPLGATKLAIVPKLGLGAGGGGLVETQGGFLVNSLLGVELAASPVYSLRVSSGYLWAPEGEFRAVPIIGELICHLDVATANVQPSNLLSNTFTLQGWRFQTLNQTYFHPQRTFDNTVSSIEMVAIQVDQIFNPWFFLSYQAASAYSGYHAGGYATGMIGPGLQSSLFWNQHLQLFTEVLVGAGGGGGLALSGGSLIEPLIGVRYAFTPLIGVQASIGELKALRNELNTPVLNIGIAMRFDTII